MGKEPVDKIVKTMDDITHTTKQLDAGTAQLALRSPNIPPYSLTALNQLVTNIHKILGVKSGSAEQTAGNLRFHTDFKQSIKESEKQAVEKNNEQSQSTNTRLGS